MSGNDASAPGLSHGSEQHDERSRPCGQEWLNAARRNPESQLAPLDNGHDHRHDHDHPPKADTRAIRPSPACTDGAAKPLRQWGCELGGP
jgi:hypothetical protein